MSTDKLTVTMRDSSVLRWTALLLIASTMFFAYMFIDVLSPLQTLLENQLGWSAGTYGTFAGSEYFLNVFVLFLIFAGIILDKMGVRFTALLSAVVMIVGGGIKLYAISSYFTEGNALYDFFNSFWVSFPATAKLACVGFAIFGCGVEMAGITVSKAIVKWFTGKEMALAMGLEMAIARLGVFAVFRLSPWIASWGTESVVRPVAVCCGLLCIGLLTFLVYFFMDRRLDEQLGEAAGAEEEDPFKISDLGILFTSKPFLIIAFLCVLYYSAIFPFQKFATSMLENRLGIPSTDASKLFSWFPIGAMILTPLLGWFLDRKGKGATMLIIGSVLVFTCHLIFAIYPLQPDSTTSLIISYLAILVLGVSFSLVPAALWPSVPKLVENRYLGSAYSVIFWIQNIGLWAFPIVIGLTLDYANPDVAVTGHYDYTLPMLIFASLGVFAFLLGIWLKAEDKLHGYGLEAPNIKKS
ncbi:MAG: MFS transporter [Bacteroides sp.]|nr:MFS transporter [Bacteroides sp.]